MRAKNDENKTSQYLPVHSSQFPDPWVRNLDSDMVLNYAEFRKIFFPIQSHTIQLDAKLKKNCHGEFWFQLLYILNMNTFINWFEAIHPGSEKGAGMGRKWAFPYCFLNLLNWFASLFPHCFLNLLNLLNWIVSNYSLSAINNNSRLYMAFLLIPLWWSSPVVRRLEPNEYFSTSVQPNEYWHETFPPHTGNFG